jgi:aminoglycoside 3-N-acetyltransferase
MKRGDYTGSDLEAALRGVGAAVGDIIFLHVSIGMLGRIEGVATIDEHFAAIHRSLRNVVGSSGTLIVPTYTYSFCRNESFSVRDSPSTIGPFTEYFRCLPSVIRSREPIFSVCAEGPQSGELLADLPRSCFGMDSLYDRLVQHNALICTIGLGIHFATFRHHIEELIGVPFRYKKRFCGHIIDADQRNYEEWIYSVPILAENGSADARALEEILLDKGEVRVSQVGRGPVMGIRALSYKNVGTELLTRSPWLSAKGPPGDPVALEDLRVGVDAPVFSGIFTLPIEDRIQRLIHSDAVTVSDGSHELLHEIAQQIPLARKEFLTGEQFDDLIVPEKWRVLDWSIVDTTTGERFSAETEDFRLAPYSISFCGRVTAAEFLNNLHTHPSESLESKRRWGFVADPKWRAKFSSGSYEIVIKTQLSFSKLVTGAALLRMEACSPTTVVFTLDRPRELFVGLEVWRTSIGLQRGPFRLLILPDSRWIGPFFRKFLQREDPDGPVVTPVLPPECPLERCEPLLVSQIRESAARCTL